MRRIILRAVLLAAACAAPGGCAAQDLADARARWERAGIADYEYTFHRVCLCPTPVPEPAIVIVRDGVVVEVRSVATGASSPPEGLSEYYTVEALFDLIDAAVREGADAIYADYHPRLGHPRRITIDHVADAVDDEFGWTAEDLRPR